MAAVGTRSDYHVAAGLFGRVGYGEPQAVADRHAINEMAVGVRFAGDPQLGGQVRSQTCLNLNHPMAAVIGVELLNSPISAEVRASLNRSAIEYAGAAATGIDNERSMLGVTENRITKANTALESQLRIITLHLGDVEGVDAYEASTRMKSLLAQVETSYTLTARIQQMSLMNYL